ncbi:hypothetical protein lbkm_2824 [Lachnospiraceae bacterium KM106-2]|nr:hypothetical protein lbkm_2824 [Lachnospiraceae bacterium KM106-2]
MNEAFTKLTVDSQEIITKYSRLRPIYISEGQFLNQFIWSGYYETEYCATEKYLFFKVKINNEYVTMMPYCKQEDIVTSFFEIKDYFNNELNQPLKMFLTDRNFVETLEQSERFIKEFSINEDRSTFDYMYEAEKLRTLKGKAMHKKKNHLNGFLKEYDGRYEYRTLCCSNMNEVKQFHEEWLLAKGEVERQNTIDSEEAGVFRIFENCKAVDCKLGGVYMDGKLEAYTIGSYNPELQCAFIHIEKANFEYKGLYNFINQQFLIHEFPDALLVNREDDLGQEGLRKSKLSYKPLRLEEKFHLYEK